MPSRSVKKQTQLQFPPGGSVCPLLRRWYCLLPRFEFGASCFHPIYAKQTQFPKTRNEPNPLLQKGLWRLSRLQPAKKQTQNKPNFQPTAFFLYSVAVAIILHAEVETGFVRLNQGGIMRRQTRRGFLRSVCAGALGGGMLPLMDGCLAARSEKVKQRPNVLFLFTDDQRFDTIGALGNRQVITPHMDALVRMGTTFTRTYIMGSMTGAVCKPSRAMLLSGQNLFDLVDNGSTIPQKEVMLPELFRKCGYVTFGTGKWHNGGEAYRRCFNRGGNIFFGGMCDHYKVPVNDFDPMGNYTKGSRYYHKGKHSSELFSDAAVDFLKRYDGKKPFFMYLSYTAPHDPRTAPKKYSDMYDAAKITLPNNFMPEHPFDNGELRIRDEKLAGWPRTPKEIRGHIADYYAMITHVDAEIGRVLAALKDSGKWQNTIIVLSGDNGLALGRHGLLGKQNLYEHSVRVPLVFCGQGIGRGEKRNALCYLHDVYPTLCDLAGIVIPKTVKTVSLAPIIRAETQKVRAMIFTAYKDYQRAVRDERYKLIEYTANGKRTTQLFDLDKDTWELKNLAGDMRYSGQVQRLRIELTRWRRSIGDDGKFWKGFSM